MSVFTCRGEATTPVLGTSRLASIVTVRNADIRLHAQAFDLPGTRSDIDAQIAVLAQRFLDQLD